MRRVTTMVTTLAMTLALTGLTQLAVAEGPCTIKGVAKFNGDKPKRKSIKMAGADPVCGKLHEKKVYPQGQKVFKDGTLPYVFVYIKKGIEGSFDVPSKPAVIDQSGCMYKPHVFGMRAGQELTIRNSADTSHNIHALPKKNSEFNFGQPKKGMEKTDAFFSKSEIMVKFKCDVHPWMSAWVGVMDHPFFDVSGRGGAFEIKDLPPGEYVVAAWHEMWGQAEQTVTVSPGAPVQEIEFVFEAE